MLPDLARRHRNLHLVLVILANKSTWNLLINAIYLIVTDGYEQINTHLLGGTLVIRGIAHNGMADEKLGPGFLRGLLHNVGLADPGRTDEHHRHPVPDSGGQRVLQHARYHRISLFKSVRKRRFTALPFTKKEGKAVIGDVMRADFWFGKIEICYSKKR